MGCNNVLAVGRPSTSGMSTMVTNCNTCSSSDLGPVDPLDIKQLGPRPKRQKVRGQIRDYILYMLGAPVLKLELDEQMIDFAVDQALKVFEDYAPREYFQFHVFNTIPGQSVYTMPPDVGLIRNVYYKKSGDFAFQSSDLDGSIPIEYFYPGGSYSSIQGGMIDPIQPIWGRQGEWVLYKQYEQMFSRVSSNVGGWEWIGGFKTIKLYPIPFKPTAVVVEHIEKNKNWAEVTQAMQEGALSYAKEMLGRIRSKYASPPGPGGGIQLDGQQLLQEAKEERQKWFEDLIYKFGEPLGPTMD